MVEIVKSFDEAKNKGLIGGQSQSDIGKIVNDVKSIIEGIKDLRGIQKPTEQKEETKKMDFNEVAPKQNNKTPVAVLKINENEIDEFLNADFKKLFENPDINPETTLKDISDKWDFLKGIIKPQIKTAIQKIAKAEIEFR